MSSNIDNPHDPLRTRFEKWVHDTWANVSYERFDVGVTDDGYTLEYMDQTTQHLFQAYRAGFSDGRSTP